MGRDASIWRSWPVQTVARGRLQRHRNATSTDEENCPGIPGPSLLPGNTEQGNMIGPGNLSLAWRDRGLGVSEWACVGAGEVA